MEKYLFISVRRGALNKTPLYPYSLVMFILAGLLLANVAAFAQGGSGIPETIAVEGGKISGVLLGENKDVRAFKGIPYAKPPVGPLRWKPPQPVDLWEGIRQCNEFGSVCMQPGIFKAMGFPLGDKFSEDCLSLNVWTAAKNENAKLPVMMWIHGGGNVAGGSTLPVNDGESLARQGVVLVSFNYRLGIFGYFAHPMLSKESPNNVSGNYGLLDIIAALKWVQKNIQAFGGDPGNVTIFGQSAGAYNVCYLMATPLAKGLFHRAIAQSGHALAPLTNRHLREGWYMLEPMEKQGERLAKDLGCSDAADPVAALRALSAEKVLVTSKAVMFGAGGVVYPPGNTFGPVVDGWVLPDDVLTIFEEGKQNLVPLIVGAAADEATISIPQKVYDTVEAYRTMLNNIFGKYADDILAKYPANGPNEIRKSFCDYVGDLLFVTGARRFVRAMEKAGGKAYLYLFTMAWPGPMAAAGAHHGGDMVYIFDNIHIAKGIRKLPFDEKHQALARAMSGYWVQFAKTGNPNKEGLIEWPAYDSAKDQHIELGELIKVGQGLRKDKLDFWDKFDAERRKKR
ncbi:MAG: carboxylesterase family protein [Syntrophaceae bacterium]|nr:carboxylesterase family protein [Syntrophaceae bacterium]